MNSSNKDKKISKTAITIGSVNRREIAVLKDRIAALETTMASYLIHTHNYDDDNGTSVTTKTTTVKN